MPYYFNLAPNYDLALTPRVLSDRGLQLDAEFRYLTAQQEGGVDGTYLPNDELRDRDRSYVHWGHLGDFARRWRVLVEAANASDNNYFEDFGQGSEGTSVVYLERDAQLRYYGTHWDLLGQLQNFQIIDQTIPEESRPYSRAPRLLARGRYEDGPLGLELRARRRGGVLPARRGRDRRARRRRACDHAGRIAGAGYYVVPRAAYRYTQYELGSVPVGGNNTPSRSVPSCSLDAGMIFERPSGRRNQRLLTFEPRVLYLYVPFRDQTELPVFDTGLPDLNIVQLFRRNRYVGADRLSDANQLSGRYDRAPARQRKRPTVPGCHPRGDLVLRGAARHLARRAGGRTREYSNLVGRAQPHRVPGLDREPRHRVGSGCHANRDRASSACSTVRRPFPS